MTFRVGQIWRLEGPHDFMIGPLNHFDIHTYNLFVKENELLPDNKDLHPWDFIIRNLYPGTHGHDYTWTLVFDPLAKE